MKFYNPFKPHIAYHPKHGYAVRKRTLLGWEYLDPDCKSWWWVMEYAHKWAMMKSVEEARERRQQYYEPEPKWKVVE
jgi:hypothetical protein